MSELLSKHPLVGAMVIIMVFWAMWIVTELTFVIKAHATDMAAPAAASIGCIVGAPLLALAGNALMKRLDRDQ